MRLLAFIERLLAWIAAAGLGAGLLVVLAYVVWVFGIIVVKAVGAIPFGHALGG